MVNEITRGRLLAGPGVLLGWIFCLLTLISPSLAEAFCSLCRVPEGSALVSVLGGFRPFTGGSSCGTPCARLCSRMVFRRLSVRGTARRNQSGA